jgi:hypothetical protein
MLRFFLVVLVGFPTLLVAQAPVCKQWLTAVYHPSGWGSNRMFLETYGNATVVNSHRDPTNYGGFLEITNGSSKFPLYYGLSGVINGRVDPLRSNLVDLVLDRSQRNKDIPTYVDLVVRWCGKEAPPGTGPEQREPFTRPDDAPAHDPFKERAQREAEVKDSIEKAREIAGAERRRREEMAEVKRNEEDSLRLDHAEKAREASVQAAEADAASRGQPTDQTSQQLQKLIRQLVGPPASVTPDQARPSGSESVDTSKSIVEQYFGDATFNRATAELNRGNQLSLAGARSHSCSLARDAEAAFQAAARDFAAVTGANESTASIQLQLSQNLLGLQRQQVRIACR